MKKLFLLYFLIFPLFPMENLHEAHLAIVIVQDDLKKVDEITKQQETPTPSNNRCPSGSSTKVKVALISASATVISGVILLIIHFYPK